MTSDAVQTFRIAGLRNPADIRVDKWGVPHIRAQSRRDAFVAQGFNAARDRLWQIDLWRKRGLGLLAENFGPGYLEQDRAARLFLYRGDMAAASARLWRAGCRGKRKRLRRRHQFVHRADRTRCIAAAA